MMAPIIAITGDVDRSQPSPKTPGVIKLNWNYAQLVADAGGIPIIVPPMADVQALVNLVDGWLIPGGDDIDAARFGEENHAKVELQDPARFEVEQRLYRAIGDTPVLGICYGCQFLNVMRGGTLIQHLPDVVGNTEHTDGTLQSYRIDEGSRLREIVQQENVEGASYHHQAIGRLGVGLSVVAKTADGVVEAIEANDKPFVVAVQWHPERTPDDPATQRLFQRFVDAARSHAETKRLTRA